MPYRTPILWTSFDPPDDIQRDKVVWVSVKSVNASWKKHRDEYVGRGGSGKGISGRYENVGNWIKNGNEVWMPWIGLAAKDSEITFSDGRHRFAWIRDHSVTSLPIQVSPAEWQSIVSRFGTSERNSVWF